MIRKSWDYNVVSAQLSVSRSMVSRYLIGDKYPSLMVMRRIARVYGWPLMEQIDCIPDQGHDTRYSNQFRWWIEKNNQEQM